MKIGILITGHPPEQLSDNGLYDAYFQRLLGPEEFSYQTWSVVDGEVGQMIDEIKYIEENYKNITMYIFDDDLFTFDRDFVIAQVSAPSALSSAGGDDEDEAEGDAPAAEAEAATE